MKCVIFTNNQKKCNELQQLLTPLNIEVVSYRAILTDPIDVIEDGQTFTANALKKLAALHTLTDHICIADDSGLEVEALNGQPGIYSARYGGEGLTDAQRCDYLLNQLQNTSNRAAQFRCVIALKLPSQPAQTFDGVCQGAVCKQPKGDFGFGYDPIFVPTGFDQTFAQLGQPTKHQLSHRAKALHQAIKAIEANLAKITA